MMNFGLTLKHPSTWSCSKNTNNPRYNSCKAPVEMPREENCSQAQWKVITYELELWNKRVSRNWKRPDDRSENAE